MACCRVLHVHYRVLVVHVECRVLVVHVARCAVWCTPTTVAHTHTHTESTPHTDTQEDEVTVLMDLGEGREVTLLEAMLADGSIVVVDALHVAWHHTVESFHRAALLERALGVLGVVVERLEADARW